MDANLISWLNNSPRNYSTGIDLYKRLGSDHELLQYFLQGKTQQSQVKLFDCLREIYYRLKNGLPVTAAPVAVAFVPKTNTMNFVASTPLEASCKEEANKHYKEMMNVRAQLFALCSVEPDGHENDENAVRLRELYALEILRLQPLHYAALETIDYVRAHGKLPEAAPDPVAEALPTEAVALERMRVNLMKNISKLNLKPSTPARVQLLEQHSAKLKLVQHAIDQL